MNAWWRTIRGYILWTYERGSLHYDVMVTLILLFVFFSPRWVNFNDKPVEHNPHPTGVVIAPDNQGGFVCQIEAAAITASSRNEVEDQLRKVIEPIAGAVRVRDYELIKDSKGRPQSYRVSVVKE